jgi:hypothetical protein
MRGILPLKAILHDRHIGTSGICPVCNGEAEDLLHMIFKYQGACSIWKELGLDNIVSHAMIANQHGSAVLEDLISAHRGSPQGYSSIKINDLVAIAAWYVWWMRRRITHGEQIPPIARCAMSIRSLASNFARSGSTSTVAKMTWTKPWINFLKLNVDATFHADSQTGAVGAFLRDRQGYSWQLQLGLYHMSRPRQWLRLWQ